MNKEENRNELPKGWKWVKFSEIIEFLTDFQANGSFAGLKENVKYYSEKNYAVLVRLKDLRNDLKDEQSFVYTDQQGYNFLKKSRVEEGDILVANVGAGVGTTLKMPKYSSKATLGPNMFRVDLKSTIDSRFFFIFSQSLSYWQQLKLVSAGSGQPKINKAQYRSIIIPLPPLSIQQVIVSKIEELFSELDKSIETLRLAQQQLKTYRQAVLKWAFEGKLTEEWRKENRTTVRLPAVPLDTYVVSSGIEPDLLAAETLSDYQVANDNGELPEGWKWKLINEIGKIKGGKRLPPNHHYSEVPTDYVYIMAGNLKDGTVTNKPTYIKEDTYNALLNYKVSGGEVYITIVGACIGDAGIIPEKIGKSILTENAAKIIELKDVFNKYLALWINSATCQENIKSKILSATLGKLALNRVGMLAIPVPSIEDQQRVVAEIESRLSVADKMEESIIQSLQQAEALRQSILKKAFEGQLNT